MMQQSSLNSTMNRSLSCIQINLRHSRSASASLAQLLLDRDIDVALLQEPYAKVSPISHEITIPNVPPEYSCYHLLSKPSYLFGAAIIAKSSLHASLIHSLSSNNAIAINVTLDARVSITYLSVYIRPSLPTISEALNPILQPLKSNDTLSLSVFAIDANAKHVLWNSKRTDVKGLELEHLLSKFPINISNKDLKTLPFAPQNTAFLDLTLHGDKIETSNWIYLDTPSLSDHPYISFSVKPIIPAHPQRFCSRNSACTRLPDSSRIQPELCQA